MLYWDMKFGKGYADWDAEPHNEGELYHVFKTFCLVNKHTSFHVAVIWCDVRQYAMVEKALEAAAYGHIQPIYWYKVEQNQQLAAHLRVPAVEVGLIAFHGAITNFSSFINVPMDLYDRHNIVLGPGQRTYIRNTEGVIVNACQKPPYLAEYFGQQYCQPHANVVVLGSGAGGDVQGLMNTGLKVHAIEQDQKQSTAMMSYLRTYKPSCQLNKIIPSTRVRGQPEPDVEEVEVVAQPVDVKCGKCEKDTQSPPGQQCHSCGGYVCPACTPMADAKECPVCEDRFREVDVVVPAAVVEHVE
jgi:hypothetical protein